MDSAYATFAMGKETLRRVNTPSPFVHLRRCVFAPKNAKRFTIFQQNVLQGFPSGLLYYSQLRFPELLRQWHHARPFTLRENGLPQSIVADFSTGLGIT